MLLWKQLVFTTGKKSACSYMALANTESLAGGEIPVKAKQPKY